MFHLLQVRMNVSGHWSVRDVWDSGWDSSGEGWSWKRFETSDIYRQVVQHLSLFSWPEQRAFKESFDRMVRKPLPQQSHHPSSMSAAATSTDTSNSRNQHPSDEQTSKRPLPVAIGLKQRVKSLRRILSLYTQIQEKRVKNYLGH